MPSDDEIDEEEEPASGDVAMRLEDVPARVRVAAAGALQGAPKISIVHTSSGQYEAQGFVDGEDQEVTISPSGAIIDTEDLDEIDLTEEDDAEPDTARRGAAPDDDDELTD